MPRTPSSENVSELVTSQINFGMAYIREARSAYESGNTDYAEIARKIAVNSYAAAVRFAGRLQGATEISVAGELSTLETELSDLLLQDQARIQSIA